MHVIFFCSCFSAKHICTSGQGNRCDLPDRLCEKLQFKLSCHWKLWNLLWKNRLVNSLCYMMAAHVFLILGSNMFVFALPLFPSLCNNHCWRHLQEMLFEHRRSHGSVTKTSQLSPPRRHQTYLLNLFADAINTQLSSLRVTNRNRKSQWRVHDSQTTIFICTWGHGSFT